MILKVSTNQTNSVPECPSKKLLMERSPGVQFSSPAVCHAMPVLFCPAQNTAVRGAHSSTGH